jgi:hypothetical protein
MSFQIKHEPVKLRTRAPAGNSADAPGQHSDRPAQPCSPQDALIDSAARAAAGELTIDYHCWHRADSQRLATWMSFMSWTITSHEGHADRLTMAMVSSKAEQPALNSSES